MTITPPERTEGFTHWEPGELALADAATDIEGMDDLDETYQVSDVRVVEEGREVEWDGEKYRGPLRVKLLASLPPEVRRAKFVYYMVQFGEVDLRR